MKAKGLEDNLALARYTLELRNERPQAELLLRYQYGVFKQCFLWFRVQSLGFKGLTAR